METAYLAGGCFWCVEAIFQRINGITELKSGYCNGSTQNPSYESICTGQTGHAEVVKIDFDESIVSALPDGDVPYTPNPSPTVDSVSKLASEYRTLYNFVKGGNNELSGTRREVLFIQLLESLMPSEAEVLCLVKDKKLGKKYRCSFPVVSEAYPDIVWGNRT